MRISEILNQTQYFFDHLASDSVTMDKIGNSVARDKFFEGLERLGVYSSYYNNFSFSIVISNVRLNIHKLLNSLELNITC